MHFYVISTKIDGDFLNRNIEFIVVHSGSKILLDLYGTKTVDRSHGFGQLLAVSKLPSSNADKMTSAHTTTSNSGRLNGACIFLEQRLNSEILLSNLQASYLGNHVCRCL